MSSIYRDADSCVRVFENLLNSLDKDIIEELEKLKDKMENVDVGIKISKGIGTGISTAGTGLAVGSFFFPPLIPFAIVTSIVGATTSVGTTAVDLAISSDTLKEVETCLRQFNSDFAKMKIAARRLFNQVLANSDQPDWTFDNAIEHVLSSKEKLDETDANIKRLTSKSDVERCLKGAQLYRKVALILCVFSVHEKAFGSVIQAFEFATKTLGIGCSSVAGVTAKMASKALIGVGCFIQVIDVVLTIADTFKTHPTVKQINEALYQLRNIRNEMKDLFDEIQIARRNGERRRA